MEIGPFGWTQQFRYVPAPDLIGRGGQQLRFGVLRMTKLVAALLQLPVLGQDAMHGAYRTEINALVQAAWHKPLPVPCREIAPSADDRALPGVQPHPEPAPAWGGASVDRLAANGDTTEPPEPPERGLLLLDQSFVPNPERRSSVL